MRNIRDQVAYSLRNFVLDRVWYMVWYQVGSLARVRVWDRVHTALETHVVCQVAAQIELAFIQEDA